MTKSKCTPVRKIPFPKELTEETLEMLKDFTPIKIDQEYCINYIHSYGQDSPFFAGLTNGKILGTRCSKCDYTYATPRLACMECGSETKWVELPQEGKIHTWTTCYFGAEKFLKETPFNLVLVEFEGADTLFLARLVGVEQDDIYIGMPIKAKFKRETELSPTDVYFVPLEEKVK